MLYSEPRVQEKNKEAEPDVKSNEGLVSSQTTHAKHRKNLAGKVAALDFWEAKKKKASAETSKPQ